MEVFHDYYRPYVSSSKFPCMRLSFVLPTILLRHMNKCLIFSCEVKFFFRVRSLNKNEDSSWWDGKIPIFKYLWNIREFKWVLSIYRYQVFFKLVKVDCSYLPIQVWLWNLFKLVTGAFHPDNSPLVLFQPGPFTPRSIPPRTNSEILTNSPVSIVWRMFYRFFKDYWKNLPG